METVTKRKMAVDDRGAEPWQLRMFRRTLKKQQKLQALLEILGPVNGKRCLLLTCGDNNGALNWHFREHGGRWSWADMEMTSVLQIAALTGDEVAHVERDGGSIPFPEAHFDVVVTIDVHEHLQDTTVVNAELARVTKPEGRVIVTTPGGDPRKLANRLKNLLGMRAKDYGHVVDGYSADELAQQLRGAGLQPGARASYSRFFTEMVELMINLVYVKLLSKGGEAEVEDDAEDAGPIAPQTEEQLASVNKSYKLWSLAYPVFWLISQLDRLLASGEGYAVIVAAQKE